jgi:hypothetical protein
MSQLKLSPEAIAYCNKIRGKNYEGCGNDHEFCAPCKSSAYTQDQINANIIKANNYVINLKK